MLKPFKEIGNILSFVKLLEESFVSKADAERCLINEIISIDPRVESQFSKLEQDLNILKTDFFKDLSDSLTFYTRVTTKQPLLFKKLLASIRKHLQQYEICNNLDPLNDENSLAKIWISLQFLASSVSLSDEKESNRLKFGDGISIGAMACLYVSEQIPSFLLRDYNGLLITKFKQEFRSKTISNEINNFSKKAAWFKRLNQESIDFLATSL